MVSYLASLLYFTRTVLCLHNSDAWMGQMVPHLPKSSNKIETFVFPSKQMFNVKDPESSRKKELFLPLYFKFRNKVVGDLAKDRSLRIHPQRYIIPGNKERY